MKKLSLFLVTSLSLFANSYYSKVEPYNILTVSSNVSGLVEYVDEDSLGKRLTKKPFIVIDDKLDKNELKLLNYKIEYMRDTLKQTEIVLKNLKDILDKKRENYNSVKSMSMKSKVEKDREFFNYKNSENAYLNTKKEIDNLKFKIEDLKQRAFFLKKSIKDKHLIANGYELYELFVKPKQFVSMGTPLAKVADTSSAKLTIYLDREDLENLENKVVYIDGVKTDYKPVRVVNIADSKNISKYKAQIIIKPAKIFSKLVKIDLEDR